jgi:hypothetical protein
VLTAYAEIVVEVTCDFFIDSFEVKIISRVFILHVHLPDAFGSVHDVQEDVSATRATGDTVVAHLKQKFRIVQATGPASLAAHGA